MKPRKIPKILSQIVWRSYRIAKRVWHLQKSNYTEGQYIKFKQTFSLLRIRRGTFDLIAWVCILTLLRKYRLLKRSIRLSVPISVKNLKCHKMSAFIENANSCLNAQYFAFGFMSFLGRVERIFPIPLSKIVLLRIKFGAMTLAHCIRRICWFWLFKQVKQTIETSWKVNIKRLLCITSNRTLQAMKQQYRDSSKIDWNHTLVRKRLVTSFVDWLLKPALSVTSVGQRHFERIFGIIFSDMNRHSMKYSKMPFAWNQNKWLTLNILFESSLNFMVFFYRDV